MSKGCTRSHPHELMDCCCEHKTEIARLQAAREAIINTIDKRNLVVVNEDDANLWYSGVSRQDDWPEGFHCEDPISAEMDRLRAEDNDAGRLIAKQAALLTGVANALKGPPAELHLHSHHDLPEIAAKLKARVAELEGKQRWHYPAHNLDLPNLPDPGQIVVAYYRSGDRICGPVVMGDLNRDDGPPTIAGKSIYQPVVRWAAITEE